MNHGRSLDRIDGWWSKPPQDLGQRALVGRQKDPVEEKRRARFVPLPVSLDNADAFIDALTQEGSLEGPSLSAARASPGVLQDGCYLRRAYRESAAPKVEGRGFIPATNDGAKRLPLRCISRGMYSGSAGSPPSLCLTSPSEDTS